MSAQTGTLNSTQVLVFPNTANTLTTRTFHIVMSAPSAASIVVQGRAKGTSAAFVAWPYKKHHLNAVVGDESYVSTAITDTSAIEVNSAGFDIALSSTYSSGTVTYFTDELVG